MLQLHLIDEQLYCLPRCNIYQRFDSTSYMSVKSPGYINSQLFQQVSDNKCGHSFSDTYRNNSTTDHSTAAQEFITYHIFMGPCKTKVSPLLMYWRYHSLPSNQWSNLHICINKCTSVRYTRASHVSNCPTALGKKNLSQASGFLQSFLLDCIVCKTVI